MKYLYINPIGESIRLIVGIKKSLIYEEYISPGRDYDDFPDTIIRIINTYNIDEIWCIIGPGAFTRMRIVTLAINALHYSGAIIVKSCHFFDILRQHSTDTATSGKIYTYTPILRANDKEYIIENSNGVIKLIKTIDIPDGIYIGYGNEKDFTVEKKLIGYNENLEKIESLFFSKPPLKKGGVLSPIYLKEPHITGSKQNTSLF